MKAIKEPRGIIKNVSNHQKFILNRVPPDDDLDYLIDHFWSVRWDLNSDENINQAVLSHPNIHLSLEGNEAFVNGIVTKRFEKVLQGSGYVFAIKFKPASFAYMTSHNIQNFTNKRMHISEIVEKKIYNILKTPMKFTEESARISEISAYLKNMKNERDDIITILNTTIKKIEQDNSIVSVDQLKDFMGMKIRKIQRIFIKYVGVSPKWIINRYRLHEAMSMIESADSDTVFSHLANDLGYFDQAHFIKDFKRMIGKTPGEYRKQFMEINEN